ncbi:MAG: DUF5689 domain-containing protein [Saprospiraceae bacterium]|nr:DUF5689 domain-containing protein [Saprospiraceae bacterium]
MKRLFHYLLLVGLLIPTACVDLDFDEPPPGGEPIDITANATILDLRSWFVPGAFTAITDELIIRGIVIADDASGNFYKTIVIQDETAGIEIKLNSVGLANDYPIGREVFIRCRGLVISDYNGLVQLGGGTYDDAGQTRLSGIEEALLKDYLVAGERDQFVTPKVKGIKDINTNDMSTLIQLTDVQFIQSDAGQTYAEPVTQLSVNHMVEDCSGNSILLRTNGYADFAGELTPSGKGTLVALLGVFGSDLQLFVRDQNDVDMQAARCGQGGPSGGDVDEKFETVGNNADVALAGWLNVATKGTRVWRGKTFSGNTYVQATAYNDTDPEMETWLITPAIDLSVAKKLTFLSSVAFWVHDAGSVLISTDFNGTNIGGATWISLAAQLPTSSTTNYDWVNSGEVDLSAYSGTGYIAFRYTGSGPGGQTTTFILDDVLVQDK